MIIHRTYDVAIVDSILKSPSVFRHIIDDNSPSLEKFTSESVIADHRNIALIVAEKNEAIGCFICIKCSSSTYEGHISLTDKCRGKKALDALNLGAEWVFLNTSAFRIVGMTPEKKRPALRITRLAGYNRITTRNQVVKILGETENIIQSELTLYHWISKLKVKSKVNLNLDEWHTQYLYAAKKLVESGFSDKAKFLLDEISSHSYAKKINLSEYPLVKIEGEIINITEAF